MIHVGAGAIMSLIAPRAATVCSAMACPHPALHGGRHCGEHRPYLNSWPALQAAIARDGGACGRRGSRGPPHAHRG